MIKYLPFVKDPFSQYVGQGEHLLIFQTLKIYMKYRDEIINDLVMNLIFIF